MTDEANVGGSTDESKAYQATKKGSLKEWSGLFKGYTKWLEGSLSSIVRETENMKINYGSNGLQHMK